jgi:hypothetical protein
VTLAPKGLLIEEQRTNLLTYSEQFDNAAWTKSSYTISQNVGVAPDGSMTADKIIPVLGLDPSAPNGTGVQFFLGLTAGVSYVYSVFAKAAEFNILRYRDGGVSGALLDVNLLTGAVTNGNPSRFLNVTVTALNDGWYRVVFATPSITNANFYPFRAAGGTGNGTSGIFIWGAQLEAGAFATSYIPTVASQVTRAADSASMIGNNFARWYNPNAGTLFAEAAKSTTAATTQFLFDVRDTSTTRISLQSFGAVSSFVVFNGVLQVALDGASTVAVGENFKVAGAYQTNDFAMSLKGTAVQTDGSGTVPLVSSANIGSIGGSSSLNGTIKRIAYYPRRLANTELTSITS